MDRKIALFILYNHHYTKNIERTEALYKGKFDHIYHIIPFYSGNRDNVITVYESSYQFQSYIAQAYQVVKHNKYSHYFVVADDMIINPHIDQTNLFSFTGIPEDAAFITDLRDLKQYPYDIPLYHNISQKGVEVKDILPSKHTAMSVMQKYNLAVLPDRKFMIRYILKKIGNRNWRACRNGISYALKSDCDTIYPAIWAYSDLLLLPSRGMENFARNCGALAGLNIFVENAIPLALLLSYEKVATEKDIPLDSISQLYNLGKEREDAFLKKYNYSLDLLLNDYPNNLFFIHPVKLSKWK